VNLSSDTKFIFGFWQVLHYVFNLQNRMRLFMQKKPEKNEKHYFKRGNLRICSCT
jgi:hypothetical protein